MKQKYNLKDFRPETLTTSRAVAKEGLITDGELYYHLNSCPFFHTYNDGEVEETETILLPFFRRFLRERVGGKSVSYIASLGALNEYLTNYKNTILPKNIKKYIRYFTNFFYLLHPSKRFDVIVPYFPYRFNYLTGCTEVVIKTRSGIRMYTYDFTDGGVDAERLNYQGFLLQLGGRVFKQLTGLTPTSLACIYPGSKTVIYYSYNDKENLENRIIEEKDYTRRYGTHCAYCLQKNCSPLIDRNDRFGWKYSENEK